MLVGGGYNARPFIYLKPAYPGLTRLKFMVHIYLYRNRITVKSPVKARGKIWLTSTQSLESQGFFHIFLEH